MMCARARKQNAPGAATPEASTFIPTHRDRSNPSTVATNAPPVESPPRGFHRSALALTAHDIGSYLAFEGERQVDLGVALDRRFDGLLNLALRQIEQLPAWWSAGLCRGVLLVSRELATDAPDRLPRARQLLRDALTELRLDLDAELARLEVEHPRG